MRLIRARHHALHLSRALKRRQNISAPKQAKNPEDFGVILGGSLATPLLRRCRVVPILSVCVSRNSSTSFTFRPSHQHLGNMLSGSKGTPKSQKRRWKAAMHISSASTFHAAAMCASCQYSISLNAPCLFYIFLCSAAAAASQHLCALFSELARDI